MKKAIFVVLALAVIWAIPGVRHRIGVALLPLFERLGPVGEMAANPVREFKARNDISFYLRIMHDQSTEGRRLPDQATFFDWVVEHMRQETGIDPWGNRYWLSRQGKVYTVGSSGADGVRGTEDDQTQAETM